MSIQYAILGLLSWRPATGYDLKKIFEDSPTLYWSGNNNQIYKSLVKLLEEEMVTCIIEHQEGAPSKKVYSITGKGRSCLKEWVVAEPELPEFRNTFLVQLAWADQLSPAEIDQLLHNYETAIALQCAYEQERIRRGIPSPHRSGREAFLWEKISGNLLSHYQHELQWVQEVRRELLEGKFD